jgi:hypothetical protein
MVMYLYVRSTSQESEWSCICMLGVEARGEWSCICMLGVHSLSWLVLLTYKYMTTHSPGLYS